MRTQVWITGLSGQRWVVKELKTSSTFGELVRIVKTIGQEYSDCQNSLKLVHSGKQIPMSPEYLSATLEELKIRKKHTLLVLPRTKTP